MHRTRLIPSLVVLALALGCKREEASKTEAQALRPPVDVLYAASAHVRVVDADSGKLLAPIDLSRAISGLLASADGQRVYAASSDGVRVLDAQSHRLLGQLTSKPARRVELGSPGVLQVLEHEVVVHPDGTREVLPFRLVQVEEHSGRRLAEEEAGQRVHYAHVHAGGFVVVTESGEIRLGRRPAALVDGTAIDLPRLLGGEQPHRVRGELSLYHQGKVYVPVEAARSALVVVDLSGGEPSLLQLDGQRLVRGLAVEAGGKALLLNTSRQLLRFDTAAGKVRGVLELPAAGHTGLALSADGRYAYLAQTVDGTGGAISVVSLDTFQLVKRIHLDDISPWALTALPGPKANAATP